MDGYVVKLQDRRIRVWQPGFPNGGFALRPAEALALIAALARALEQMPKDPA